MNFDSDNVLKTVECFTMPFSNFDRKTKKKFKNITNTNRGYLYKDDEYRFIFYTLSTFVEDDLIVQELQSVNRCNNSCYKNVITANLFDDSKIIIGFVEDKKNIYLHSWVEATVNGVLSVVDYTKNLVMDRGLYYSLANAEKSIEFHKENFKDYYNMFLNAPELDSREQDIFDNREKAKVNKYIKSSKQDN